jgi:glyoxylase-like metal-dependent hydrolase (beta-lactamase superfamily II)
VIETLLAPNPGPFTLDGTRTYVVEGELAIDPGPAIDAHLDAIAAAAPRLRTIVVTHRHGDHAPGALALRERSGARLLAPRGTWERGEADADLDDGMILRAGGVEIEAIATPGHTREHFCFLTREGDLFTGDMILGEGTTVIFPPDGHMGDYLASLAKLRERNPQRIFPGHGPVRSDAAEWIDYYIAHRLGREREISAHLARAPLEIPELRRLIYPALDPRLEEAAELQLEAHLVHLEEQGRVAKDGTLWRARNG